MFNLFGDRLSPAGGGGVVRIGDATELFARLFNLSAEYVTSVGQDIGTEDTRYPV